MPFGKRMHELSTIMLTLRWAADSRLAIAGGITALDHRAPPPTSYALSMTSRACMARARPAPTCRATRAPDALWAGMVKR